MRAFLLALLFWLIGASAYAQPTIDVSAEFCSSCSATSNSKTITTSSANEIIIVFGANDFGNTCESKSISDTSGLSWVLVWNNTCAVRGINQIWWAVKPTAGSTTITMTATGSFSYPQGWVYSITNADTTTPFDTNSPWTSSSSNTTAAITTIQSNDLLLCGQLNDVATTLTGAGVLTQSGTSYQQWYGYKQLAGNVSATTYQLVTDTGGTWKNNACVGVRGANSGRSRLIQ